jgi:hypothetical protein
MVIGTTVRQRSPRGCCEDDRVSLDADYLFMRLGVEYYISARLAAQAGLSVCGNVYHTSLEMLLKAGLSRKNSLEQLHKIYYHKLIKIWDAFKLDFPDAALNEFNATVAHVARFNNLRYPDARFEELGYPDKALIPDTVLKEAVRVEVVYRGATPGTSRKASSTPTYRFCYDDVDRLIAAIFQASSRNPAGFMGSLKPQVREIMENGNPAAKQLFPQRAAE